MTLLHHRPGQIFHSTQPRQRRRFRVCPALAPALLFCPQVGQMITEFLR
jgi:hypothetical protein